MLMMMKKRRREEESDQRVGSEQIREETGNRISRVIAQHSQSTDILHGMESKRNVHAKKG
jgi:hypothetical protein